MSEGNSSNNGFGPKFESSTPNFTIERLPHLLRILQDHILFSTQKLHNLTEASQILFNPSRQMPRQYRKTEHDKSFLINHLNSVIIRSVTYEAEKTSLNKLRPVRWCLYVSLLFVLNIIYESVHLLKSKIMFVLFYMAIMFSLSKLTLLLNITSFKLMYSVHSRYSSVFMLQYLGQQIIRGYIQKFPDWQPGARTANDKALCH